MNIVVLDGYTLNPGDNPWDELARLGTLVVHDRTPAGQIVERATRRRDRPDQQDAARRSGAGAAARAALHRRAGHRL